MVHRLQATYHRVLSGVEEPGEVGHSRLVVGGRPALRLPVEPPLPPPRLHRHARRLQGEQVSVTGPGGCSLRKTAAEPDPAGVKWL